ncbi:CdaR family protein, partial [Bacillus subtilis]
KHTITLSQSGLSKEVSAKIDPQTAKVKISKKATKTFPVQARYNSSNVASGYATGSVTMNNQTVRVTGAKNDVKNVEIVVANVNIPSGTKNDVVRSVLLQALDKKGKSLDVVFDPETVRVTIPVFEASSSKKVSLNLVQSDGEKNRSYSISTDTKTVVLHGTKQALSKVSTLTVPVSVEGVTSSVTRTIQLQSTISGIASISPATISVTITASGDNNESSADVSQTNKIDNSLNNDKTEDDSSKTSSNISVSSSNSEKSSESNN